MTQISILLYADDMILLAKNETDLQYMLDAMNEWAIKWRLKSKYKQIKYCTFST